MPGAKPHLPEIKLHRAVKPGEVSELKAFYWDTVEREGSSHVVPPFSSKEIANNHFFFILADGERVGATGIAKRGPSKRLQDQHSLRGMLILEEFRGRGIFPIAEQALLKEAKKLGLKEVFVGTMKSNTKMREWLEKTGWGRVGKRSLNPLKFVDRKGIDEKARDYLQEHLNQSAGKLAFLVKTKRRRAILARTPGLRRRFLHTGIVYRKKLE